MTLVAALDSALVALWACAVAVLYVHRPWRSKREARR